MAILIGVVALAVLPNIGRSRESKDLQTLDNILASTNVAFANNQTKSAGSFKYGSSTAATGTGADKVKKAVEDELGTINLGSVSGDITVEWTNPGKGSAPVVSVYAGDGKQACEYTTAASGEPAVGDKRA